MKNFTQALWLDTLAKKDWKKVSEKQSVDEFKDNVDK